MAGIIPQDLYQFSLLNGVRLSPDGRQAAFVRACPDAQQGGYRSEIWRISLDDGCSACLYTGFGCRLLGWKDSQTLLILDDGCKSLAMDGTQKSLFPQKGIQNFALLDNGQFAYTVTAKRRQPASPLVTEMDELPFWVDGRGHRNQMRDALMLHDPSTGETIAVSDPAMSVSQMAVSPDGSKIAFAATSYEGVMPKATGLHVYHIRQRRLETLQEQSQNQLHLLLAFLSDDVLLAARDAYRFLGSNPCFSLYYLKEGIHRQLPFADVSIGGGMVTDLSWGSVNNYAVDNEKLYFASPKETSPMVMLLENDGLAHALPGTENVLSFDVSGDIIVFSGLSSEHLPELYMLDMRTQERKRLTSFHDHYLQTHTPSKPRAFTWSNRCGLSFEGWILPPAHLSPGKRYPGILSIHGGPLGVWNDCFNHEMQCLSEAGFFVFYTNPRGASGRGEAFSNLSGISGTIDYEDLMDFCDRVIAAEPQIDPDRLGVCGGSYGGFMCNWIIGHTQRFRAAVSQRSISNFFTKQLCSDNGYIVTRALTQADPIDSPERLWHQSPLRYADNVTTPTLFIQSDQDYCCYLSDSLQMYTALKKRSVPARLCMFHGESHGLSRTGRPPNRIARLNELISWFERWLKG